MALALWTFAYFIVGMLLFGFAMMGDCFPSPEGDECLALKDALPLRIMLGELIVYILLTWAIFIRRWRRP